MLYTVLEEDAAALGDERDTQTSQIVETMHSPLAQRCFVLVLIVVVPLIRRACLGGRQRR